MTDELSSSSPRRSRRRHAPDPAWAARLTAQLPTPTPLPSDAAAGHCMCPAVTIEVEGDGSPEQTAGDGQTVEEGPAQDLQRAGEDHAAAVMETALEEHPATRQGVAFEESSIGQVLHGCHALISSHINTPHIHPPSHQITPMYPSTHALSP